MKNVLLLLLITGARLLHAQNISEDNQRTNIAAVINQYSEAREKRDTVLLKTILTDDIDQLVSTGEWRNGMRTAIKGMQGSSANNPGTRTLTIEKIRLLNQSSAIVDCRYEIKNTGGTIRKMWSTFVVVTDSGKWKISAIRNMLPAGNNIECTLGCTLGTIISP